MTVLYDPPSGWMYGFPKPYAPLADETLAQSLVRDGYPAKDAEFASQYCRFIGDIEELKSTKAKPPQEENNMDLARHEDARLVQGFGAVDAPPPAYVAGNDNAVRDDIIETIFAPLDQLPHHVPNLGQPSPHDGKTAPRRGDYIGTYTGRKFWPMDPHADDVSIVDIAHSLSMQCRYAGHCRKFYSVAEHSVLIAQWLLDQGHGQRAALWGLLHDAAEAYLVDVPRPVKPYLAGYASAEADVMAAIAAAFCLGGMPRIVKEADNWIIGDEIANLAPMEWHREYKTPLGVTLKCWEPHRAKYEFMSMYGRLARVDGVAA
jgi:hypothetical protein